MTCMICLRLFFGEYLLLVFYQEWMRFSKGSWRHLTIPFSPITVIMRQVIFGQENNNPGFNVNSSSLFFAFIF